jgi:hypothetical protein
MIFIPRQEPFVCAHCGASVEPLKGTGCRNHCPKCLRSLHVDQDGPGDRLSECRMLMDPIAIDQQSGGFVIVHRCRGCKKEIRNKAAADDDVEVMGRVAAGSV